MRSRFKIRLIPLVLLLAVFFLLVQNLPLLLHMKRILQALEHFRIGFAISIPLFLLAALNLVFVPFSIRFLLKPFFAVLLVLGAMASWGAWRYGIVFDREQVQNILETHTAEVMSFVTAGPVIWVLLTGLLPAILLFLVHIEYPASWWRGMFYRLGSMLASVAVLLLVAALYYQDYASVGRNNPQLKDEIMPINFVLNSYKYVRKFYLSTPEPFQLVGTDAKRVVPPDQKPSLVFLVVGETARAMNYPFNGYGRETTPFTAGDPNMVNFVDVRSCGTATAQSLPCMLSNQTQDHYDQARARNSDSLLDILKRTGVAVDWSDNDDGCKGTCLRVPNRIIQPKDFPKYCDGEVCVDMAMLEHVDERIAGMSGDKLLVFHLFGSHGPTYFKRYPPEHRHFVPDCARADIENCDHEQLVNAYDNTIRYTDYVLAQMIETLRRYSKDYDTALLYASDHGESLGENGLYLHGIPYRFAPIQQRRVPMQIWISPGMAASRHLDLACLRQRAGEQGHDYSHDNIFPSMLGLWNVQTTVYDEHLDVFAPCRSH